MARRTVPVFAALALTACASAWQLAGEPGLLLDVKHYYERNATEEQGYCTSPILDGVTRSEIVSDDEDELVVRLRYVYRDFVRGDEDCDDGVPRPARCIIGTRRCHGFAERTFTIARTPDGLEVVEMSGERRRARRDWSKPQP